MQTLIALPQKWNGMKCYPCFDMKGLTGLPSQSDTQVPSVERSSFVRLKRSRGDGVPLLAFPLRFFRGLTRINGSCQEISETFNGTLVKIYAGTCLQMQSRLSSIESLVYKPTGLMKCGVVQVPTTSADSITHHPNVLQSPPQCPY